MTTTESHPIRNRGWWGRFWVGVASFLVAIAMALQSVAQAPADTGGFWGQLHTDGLQYAWYSSLEEMVEASSAVVVGQITSVKPGRTVTPEPQYALRASAHYLDATVAVDAVLAGELHDQTARVITIELFAANVDAIPLIIDSAPDGRAIYFLLNKAVHPATVGLSSGERAAEARYYEIMGSQAVLIDEGGFVAVRTDVPAGEFPRGLQGTNFDAMADAIASLGR